MLLIVKILLFILWWLPASFFAGRILGATFKIEKSFSWILGGFLGLFILGAVANIFTAWLILSDLTIIAAFIITTLILFGLKKLFPAAGPEKAAGEGRFRMPRIFFVGFGVLAAGGWYFIALAKTGGYLITPWQVLSPWYVLIIFLLAIFIYALVFSKQRTLIVLFCLIIFSLLLHSYFLVYEQGFGGDKWRHLGSEYRILSGQEYQPTLLTDNLWYREIAGLEVPRALIDGPKLSYGFQWSLSVIFSRITNIDVFYLDQYLFLILGAVFLPLILFAAAKVIWPNRQFALLTAALPVMFFVLQYYGAQTLPASYGFLSFIFLLAIWLSYLKNNERAVLVLAIFLTALMYFNYSLTFILAVMFGILVFLVKLSPSLSEGGGLPPARAGGAPAGWGRSKKLIKYLGLAFLSVVVFLLDAFSAGSQFIFNLNFKSFFVHLARASSFLYFEAGKFQIFNLPYSWHIAEFFALVFSILLLVFLWQIAKSKNRLLQFLAWGAVIIFINYVLSWQFSAGLHVLARRLDVFLVILLAIIFAWGVVHNFASRKIILAVAILFLTCLTVITYISGPVQIANVTTHEAQAMKYVWQEISPQPADYCVLANTWPLLALEAYSAKEVVAGNFPSDYNHQQPERVKLFDEINQNPTRQVLNDALAVENKKACFLVLENAPANIAEKINILLGQPKVFGDNFVWRFD